ncbi:capsule assembly Wzi family protein [Pseudoalteromonas spongiae]|uniref:capsule assembly Wzi family protein n=1 Tax=Pseudoalteromonas spongiae TaxID=298657 RepID=UPI000C2D345A|nr:capsule assembly Wzi family protein [Pseudoalteromonas spongiae]
MKLSNLLIIAGAFVATESAAKPTVYLPLGIDAHLETQLDRMFALTSGTPMHKPYALSEVDLALRKLKQKDSRLYRYLVGELKRYRGEDKISRYGLRTTASSGDTMPIANQRGLTTDEYAQGFFEGIWRPNDFMLAQIGVDYRVKGQDLVAYNSTLSMAAANLQLDIGYRDHWYSPFKNSAQIMSNNAQMPMSISLGTVEPLNNWWNLDFELFYTELDEVKEGIQYQGEWHDGSPELVGMHGSIEPLHGWKIGFNRVMQFGGGPRETDISDIFKAFFDPSGNDNADNDLSTDDEFGDQMISFTSSVYFDWVTPIEIYAEYGAEDTLHGSNFKFGNQTISFGTYLPKLTNNSSLRYEYNKWNTLWYVHHLYKNGNTNEGFAFGHFAADNRNFGDGVPADVHTINYDYFESVLSSWQFKLSTQNNDSDDYQRAYSLSLLNSRKVGEYRVETSLMGGKNVYDESYGYLSITMFW